MSSFVKCDNCGKLSPYKDNDYIRLGTRYHVGMYTDVDVKLELCPDCYARCIKEYGGHKP